MTEARFAKGNREASECRTCHSPIWIVYQGPRSNHLVEPRQETQLATVVAEREDFRGRVKSMHEALSKEAERTEQAFRERDRLRSEVAGYREALTELLEAAEDLTRFPRTRRAATLTKACDTARAALSANRASPEGGSE